MTTRITSDEILLCLRLLLEYAAEQGLSGVDATNADLYWTMTSQEWLVADTEPTPGVGSLHDDINELRRLLKAPEQASSVDVDRLANILRLLSVQLTDLASQHGPPNSK